MTMRTTVLLVAASLIAVSTHAQDGTCDLDTAKEVRKWISNGWVNPVGRFPKTALSTSGKLRQDAAAAFETVMAAVVKAGGTLEGPYGDTLRPLAKTTKAGASLTLRSREVLNADSIVGIFNFNQNMTSNCAGQPSGCALNNATSAVASPLVRRSGCAGVAGNAPGTGWLGGNTRGP